MAVLEQLQSCESRQTSVTIFDNKTTRIILEVLEVVETAYVFTRLMTSFVGIFKGRNVVVTVVELAWVDGVLSVAGDVSATTAAGGCPRVTSSLIPRVLFLTLEGSGF